ncbi:MAG: hypothetical protein HYZ87_00325 [Candidatus Omnitrophica bacterium]|nr:hypothetical protein [Candidatus Omnitrophota bacterium]
MHAHNYTLNVTVDASDADGLEERLTRQVREALIDKVHSRDLGLHVDFLKGSTINELNLTTVFWGIVKKAISPVKLLSLTLEKDSHSQLTLSQD